MKPNIRLVALDLDGTLFNEKSEISPENQNAIRAAAKKGVETVISTGRPYNGLPLDTLISCGVRYAITGNGSGIYELASKKRIYASTMESSLVHPIVEKLQQKNIHIDIFINGNGFTRYSSFSRVDSLPLPQSIRHYIKSTRILTKDLAEYIRSNHANVEKVTLNFYPLADGTLAERDAVIALLRTYPQITFLTGGYRNIEFTKAGTSKALGLSFLCNYLGIGLHETMACGDSQNDIEILKTAAAGIAMGNALREVKLAADYVTLSNEEDGVAFALHHFLGH